MVSISGPAAIGPWHVSRLRRLLEGEGPPGQVRSHIEALFGEGRVRHGPIRSAVEDMAALAREHDLAARGARLPDLYRFFRRYGREDPAGATDLVLEARGLRDRSAVDDGAAEGQTLDREVPGPHFVAVPPNERLLWLVGAPARCCDRLIGHSHPVGEGGRGARYRLGDAWPEIYRVEAVRRAWLDTSASSGLAIDWLFERLEPDEAGPLVHWWAERRPALCVEWLSDLYASPPGDRQDIDLGLERRHLAPLLSHEAAEVRRRALTVMARRAREPTPRGMP